METKKEQVVDTTELDKTHVRKAVKSLVIAVLCKVTFLVIMFFLFFSPSHRESGDLRNLFLNSSETTDTKEHID